MQSIAPALRVFDVRGNNVPWDVLRSDYKLPDEPVWDKATLGAYERTPRALPVPTSPPRPQTPVLAPDLSLTSPTLLALSEGSPALAAPNIKPNYNAADAAIDELWPEPDAPSNGENEFVEPERRSRSLTRSPPGPRWNRRRGVQSAPTSPFGSAGGSDDILLSPPSPISTMAHSGRRTGRLLAHDADVSPLRLPVASSSASSESPVTILPAHIDLGPPVVMMRTHRRRWSDGDSYGADEVEEDWSIMLLAPPAEAT